MEQLDLPFRIDMQFDNWEFDLDFLPQRIARYYSFKYIGKEFNILFNIVTHKTELIFNADYLTAVIITINNANITMLVCINSILSKETSKVILIDKFSTKFTISDIVYYTKYFPKKRQILVFYGKPNLTNKLLTII